MLSLFVYVTRQLLNVSLTCKAKGNVSLFSCRSFKGPVPICRYEPVLSPAVSDMANNCYFAAHSIPHCFSPYCTFQYSRSIFCSGSQLSADVIESLVQDETCASLPVPLSFSANIIS